VFENVLAESWMNRTISVDSRNPSAELAVRPEFVFTGQFEMI
jgi:hypothetical protein